MVNEIARVFEILNSVQRYSIRVVRMYKQCKTLHAEGPKYEHTARIFRCSRVPERRPPSCLVYSSRVEARRECWVEHHLGKSQQIQEVC